MTAMMTGLMPSSRAPAWGVLPYRTYIQAKASTNSMAGRMNSTLRAAVRPVRLACSPGRWPTRWTSDLDQVAPSQQVQEVLLAQPFPPLNDLLSHQGNVGGRSAEGDHTELQEQRRDFAKMRCALVLRVSNADDAAHCRTIAVAARPGGDQSAHCGVGCGWSTSRGVP